MAATLGSEGTEAGLQAGSLCSYPPRAGAWPV
jgi:hypothetical protein